LHIFFHIDKWRKDSAPRATVVHGSHIMFAGDHRVNRSDTTSPGQNVTTAKHVLTEWEKAIGLTPSNDGLTCLKSPPLGVTICLDAEFPASGRALAEAGMLFQCVPAWTETMHGFHRVRTACRARAVENQVCIIHSSLVGQVGNEKCVGSSAIIVPPHEPFPEDPILAETPMNEEGIAFAEVDPEDLLRCREMGEVRNWRDRDAGDWTVRRI
jgi:predicted amidohydrolase